MKFLIYLCTLTLCFTSALDTECILLSFPRSGNTLVRYCLEALTKRPTTTRLDKSLYEDNRPYEGNRPLDKTFKLDVDYSKPYIIKAHAYNQMGYKVHSNQPLIFLIRNPKECMLSHYASLNSMFNENKYFFDNIEKFDKHQGEKILIYYEDLIANPKPELQKLLYFLSDDNNKDQILENFMKNIELHKKSASLFYQKHMKPTDESSDGTAIYYTKNMDKQVLMQIDRDIQMLYPQIWEKYLIRYKESSTNTSQDLLAY